MKFILDESTTLEEAKGNYKYTKSTNIKTLANANQNQLNKRDRKRVADYNAGKTNSSSTELSPDFVNNFVAMFKEKGISERDINDTLDLIKKDSNQKEKYTNIVNNYMADKSSSKGNNEQQANNQETPDTQSSAEQPSEQSDQSKTEPEEQSNNRPETVIGSNTANALINYFEKSNDKETVDAFNLFKKGIGNHLEDSNYPFVRLMSMPAFASAIGADLKTVESLTEASGFGSIASTLLGDKISKAVKANDEKTGKSRWKAFKRTAEVSKFIRAYNSIVELDNNLVNKYLDKAKEKSILCDGKLYSIDKDQIKRAVNIDIAGWLTDDENKRRQILGNLRKAVVNNKVGELSTYKLTTRDREDNNPFKQSLSNLDKLSKEDQEKYLAAITKKIKGS